MALAAMREGGRRLARVLAQVRSAVRPGVSTAELDAIAERLILEGGDTPSFKGYHGFPATLCTSVNDEVVHGIPSAKHILQEGDIVGLDIGLVHGGYHADMAATVGVGTVSPEARALMEITEEALRLAIAALRPGLRVGIVGATVQSFVESHGYGVVRDLVGHGIGRRLHEEPSVPNFGSPDFGPVLGPGMTLAIEPMVTAGGYRVGEDEDRWTIRTEDGSLAAHFEHTVAITESGAEILTEAG